MMIYFIAAYFLIGFVMCGFTKAWMVKGYPAYLYDHFDRAFVFFVFILWPVNLITFPLFGVDEYKCGWMMPLKPVED